MWRWNAVGWRRCAFPSAERIDAAAAAGHQLFVATETGAIWRGRADAWQRVLEPLGGAVRDLAWFGERLWAGVAGGGVWTVDGRTAPRRPAGLAPAMAAGIERLDVAPGGTHLLLGAAAFDGEQWDVLVDTSARA